MGRAARIMRLLDLLPSRELVRASDLAGQLGVSVRTVYRDIALLRAQGHPVSGSPGVGYLLAAAPRVPAMTLTADEADALALGLRLVSTWGDVELSAAAGTLYARLPDALLPDGRRSLQHTALVAPYSSHHVQAPEVLPVLRRATRERRRLRLRYTDEQEVRTSRVVRPLSVAFFAPVWILTVWCELRHDFRSLRADRIDRAVVLDVFEHQPGRELADFLDRPT